MNELALTDMRGVDPIAQAEQNMDPAEVRRRRKLRRNGNYDHRLKKKEIERLLTALLRGCVTNNRELVDYALTKLYGQPASNAMIERAFNEYYEHAGIQIVEE